MPINVPQVNPRLATITAPNLPKIDVLGSVGAGLNFRDRLVKNRQQEGLQALIDARGQEALEGSQDAINEIALQGKEGLDFAVQLQKIAHSRNDSEIKSAKDRIKRFGTFYASIINENPEFQRRALFDEANKLLSEGDRENGAEMLQASQSRDPLDMQSHIQQNLILSQSGDKYLQSFAPGKVSAANTKFIGTPQRIIRDNKAFLSGVAQKSDGSFGLVEVAIDGEFADVQGVTASQKADQAADIAEATSAGKARGELRSARQLAKEKKRGATSGEIESGLVLAANTARRSRPKIQKVRDALDAIETGKFSQAKSILGPFIPLLNIDDEEVMQAQITKFALDELNKQSGTKTDFDFQKAQEASASLGKTTAANKRILEIIIEDLDRIEEEERQFINFIDNEGGDALRFRFKDKASSTGIDSERKIQTSVDIEQLGNISKEELEQQILEAESNG